jgi:ubiquinone/menaquinone biosynthesis C-methylase UbiE
MADFRAKVKKVLKQRIENYFGPKRVYSARGKLELARQRVEPLRERITNELLFEHICRGPCYDDAEDSCELTIVAMRDRYGFPVRLALCHQTGLLYLVDRLTPDAYNVFYKEGLYRELIATFRSRQHHNKSDLVAKRYEEAKANAQLFVRAIKQQISLPAGATLLDVGGSAGVLANAFVETFKVEATVLDPAEEELRCAADSGMKTKLGLIEQVDFCEKEKYDIIVINQAIEHVIDIRKSFNKIHALLNKDGYVIFDILDFISVVEFQGCTEAASQLDHCYFLYDEMVDVFCRRLGLIIERRIHHMPLSMLYICRKAKPDPRAIFPKERLLQITRKLITQDILWEKGPRGVLRFSPGEHLLRWSFRRL